MSTVNQLPRSSVIWLLLAQFAVMLPHVPRLSWWMMAIWLLCAAWRLAMFRGQASYPGALIRIVLVVLGCTGIAIEFGSLGALDIAVALLILAFSLKLIEVKQRRDLFLVLYLAYFIIAAAFLFSQSLLLALYQIACVVLVTAALVAMQQTANGQSASRTWKISIKLIAQAVPIMLVFFIVFPRLGPLWSVPRSDASASTGMSDSMSPGDVANLSKSSELAFRVWFEDEIPDRQQLYWRATTLSFFDGRAWNNKPAALRQASNRDAEVDGWHTQVRETEPFINNTRPPIRYEITLEPTEQRWVFALPVAFAGSQASSQRAQFDNQGLIATNDLSIRSKTKFYQRSILSLSSQLDYIAEPTLSAYRRHQETAIPDDFNPRAKQQAIEWYRQAGSDKAYVQMLMRYFSEQPFYYTLQPPKLGRHSIDEFMFDTRMGFCEYYSGAFTFMLRAVGIPARVVIGYQGGEENPFNQTLIVRQFDAHAWAEMWLEGSGWVRVDPTAAVAPERILEGLDAALSDRREFMPNSFLSPFKYRDIAWLSKIRLRLDAVNYAWFKWVINFDTAQQMRFLERILGEVNTTRIALLILATLGAVIAVVSLSLLRHRVSASVSAETRLYWQFCQRLEKLGLERAAGEAPGDFCERVVTRYPHLSQPVRDITRQFQSIAYQSDLSGPNPRALSKLRKAVSAFRPKNSMKKGFMSVVKVNN